MLPMAELHERLRPAAQGSRGIGVSRSAPRRSPAGLRARTLSDVLAYMNEHMSEPVGLAELANVAHVSRFHFTRLFKTSTGLSPMAYLERSRIRRAQELIVSGEMRLAEIAVAMGLGKRTARRLQSWLAAECGRIRRSNGFPGRPRIPLRRPRPAWPWPLEPAVDR